LQEHQVFEQRVEGAEKVVDFLAAFGAGTVGLGGLEQLGVIAGAERGFQHDEGVAAGGDIAFEIEGQGASDGAFAEAGDQRALPGIPIGTKLGEPALDLGGSERAQIEGHGAGANRGQQFSGVFGEQKNVANSGGSSRTLSSELAASFMKAELVKM
jgi:hypothetical protein